MPLQNQPHEAAASLKLELVAAIRGAFEVAVEIAVREVTELVGQTTDRYLKVMRKENDAVWQKWKRVKDYTGPIVGRIELPLSQRHLQNNSEAGGGSASCAAGHSAMGASCAATERRDLSMEDKVSAFHLEEELLLISSDEDTAIGGCEDRLGNHLGYGNGDSARCSEETAVAAQNMKNKEKILSHTVDVKHGGIKEENGPIMVEQFSLREEQSSLSAGLEKWHNVEPQSRGLLPSSRQTEELRSGRPAQTDISKAHVFSMESVAPGSFLHATEVLVPQSAIKNIYNTLGQTISPASLTQTKRSSPFRCTICHRGFNHLMNLKTHLRIHTGERPYSCPTCSRCFRHSNALTRHVRIHTGEKPYNCRWCGKSFRHLAGLKIHQRSHE